jgi:hypothetical protein
MSLKCGDVSSQWELRYVKVNLKIPRYVTFKGWCKGVEPCARQSPAVIFRARESWHGGKRRKMPDEDAIMVSQKASGKPVIMVILCRDT